MDPFSKLSRWRAPSWICAASVFSSKTHGHRGRTGYPLYGIRRTLRTPKPPLSTRQKTPTSWKSRRSRRLSVVLGRRNKRFFQLKGVFWRVLSSG